MAIILYGNKIRENAKKRVAAATLFLYNLV
jgi:hypothetical protein